MRLLVAFSALLTLVSCTAQPQRQEEHTAPVESKAGGAHPTLIQQKLCAEQAKKAFDEYEEGGHKPGEMSDYTSHLDVNKNVCYVRVSTTTATKQSVTNSVSVFDAFERRVFANYIWVNNSGKKYWEVKPLECDVHPQQQAIIYCQSSDEFDELVEKWFGVAQ